MILLSWIGTICILVGMWLIGNKKWWAFGFSVVGEIAYIIYALLTPQPQWALVVLSVVILGMAVRNMLKWRNEE